MNSFTTISIPIELNKKINVLSSYFPKKKKYEIIESAVDSLIVNEDNSIGELSDRLKTKFSFLKTKKKIKASDIKIEDAYLNKYDNRH